MNQQTDNGHTLTEIFVDGKWAIFDPSPCMPWPFLELPDGTLANAWDINQDPTIPGKCPAETVPPSPYPTMPEKFAGFFQYYHLGNYSLEESTRNMAMRFLRLVTAQKIVDNYDYNGHMANERLSVFADLDQTVQQWFAASLRKEPTEAVQATLDHLNTRESMG